MLAMATAVRLAQAPTSQSADPQRAIVERADAIAKELEGEQITDPTVFVKSAALGALTGIELSKLAESKSRNANIRGVADRMLKTHSTIRTDLTAVAKRKRLDVPTSLVYEDEQMLGQGAEKTGADFEAWYTQQVVTENDKAIALFRGASNLPDVDLAAFAKKMLPALIEQQKAALALSSATSP